MTESIKGAYIFLSFKQNENQREKVISSLIAIAGFPIDPF